VGRSTMSETIGFMQPLMKGDDMEIVTCGEWAGRGVPYWRTYRLVIEQSGIVRLAFVMGSLEPPEDWNEPA